MSEVKIFVIDNGGQWTHREWRVLKYLGVETRIFPNTTPFEELVKEGADGLVLSGGAPRIGLNEQLGRCGEYLEKGDFPILGICAGHQFMARFFGGKVEPADVPEFGKIELIIDEDHEIFEGLPKKSVAWASHNDEVTIVPEEFVILAHSKDCKVEAMAHKSRPLVGLQFHPEVEHTEFGVEIFKNFIDICRENR